MKEPVLRVLMCQHQCGVKAEGLRVQIRGPWLGEVTGAQLSGVV